MTEIPIKKYRVKRAFKWLKRTVVPPGMLARDVARLWRKVPTDDWPPAGQSELSGLQRYEYSWLSQNGEDGIIRHIFDRIGFESRHFVEFGFGARQSNALRLILQEQFHGLMMDSSEEQCFFFNRAAAIMRLQGVEAVHVFLDLNNLETVITDNETPRDIDFLSIDVNGNDYWFWEKLTAISPRLVCIEYNSGLGPEWCCTIPYSAYFERFSVHPSGFFAGASLSALEPLGIAKGYRLVGCDKTGTNAFFLRNDIDAQRIPTLTAREAFKPHANWVGRGFSEAEQLEIMRTMPYVDV